MYNHILHWFVTLAPVESSEVRVCSDVMPLAILLSVPEPTHVIQPYHDTVLTIKQSVCFTSTGQRHCIPRNWIICIPRYRVCTPMPNDLRNEIP